MAGRAAEWRARGFGGYIAPGLTIGLVLLASTSAWAQDAKWGPHIDLEAKPGTKRSLGEGDAFIPLAQDGVTLLFANLRYRFDDSDGNEGNYGLGVRHMLDSGWNIGGYGYFDRRRSEYGNYFHQVTLGVEALSQDWDLRANYYAPVGRTTHLVDSLSIAEVSGTTVVFRGGEERSMGGFDAELGWRVPVFDADSGKALRIYGGGYRFADDGLETIAGPRARIEMTFDALEKSWDGTRFSVGAEWQHDDPRGSQGFLTARLRIPLQVYGKRSSQLTPMERRMADPIVRDIDVVSQAGRFSAPEPATQTADGKTITVLNSASTAGNDLDTAVAGAGDGSTVILSGTFQVGTGNGVTMAFNQTLMAGAIGVRSASGRIATLNSPATIAGTNVNTNGALIEVRTGGALQGLTISNAFSGGTAGITVVVGSTATGVNLLNNVITVTQSGSTGGSALTFGNNTAGTVRGNTITAIGSGSATTMTALGLGGGNVTATVAGNTLSVSGGAANSMATLNGTTTILGGSTGNIRGSGACNGTPASGNISFTDGTTCP